MNTVENDQITKLRKINERLELENNRLKLQVQCLALQLENSQLDLKKSLQQLKNQQTLKEELKNLRKDVLFLQQRDHESTSQLPSELNSMKMLLLDHEAEVQALKSKTEHQLQMLLQERELSNKQKDERSISSQNLEQQAAKLIEIGQKLESKARQTTLPSIQEKMYSPNHVGHPSFDDAEIHIELKKQQKTQNHFLHQEMGRMLKRTINITKSNEITKSMPNVQLPSNLRIRKMQQ